MVITIYYYSYLRWHLICKRQSGHVQLRNILMCISRARGRFLMQRTVVFLVKIPWLAVGLLCVSITPKAHAFDLLRDSAAIGTAFMTHLTLHEMGHQVVAEEVGADSAQMQFFAIKDGKFYPGLSTAKNVPKESRLPYAIGGEYMAGHTFEFALQSYRRKPSTYNKALMFFSGTDFLWYTLLAYYVYPQDDSYDPNIIREETGLSKEVMLSFVVAKVLLNAYRVYDKDAKFIPILRLDRTSAAFVIRFDF